VLLGLSLALNLMCLVGIGIFFIITLALGGSLAGGSAERIHLTEEHHSGKKSASDKIAIIQVNGVLAEGLLGYAHRQIEQAGDDKKVKAIVLRINSPGGTITASDDLYHRLTELRDGKDGKPARPLVVSMGSLAASGGYYIAMPGGVLYAERTTLTGSIGVYASLLNVRDLADKYGVHMDTIKAGAIKDSGSPFHELTPHERAVWQHMVNHAYDQFKEIVETGRPKLAGKLEEPIVGTKPVMVRLPESIKEGDKVVQREVEKPVPYQRQRADGGIWTADEAQRYGLIDKIGYLDDAIKEAAQLAGLEKYEAITYDRPLALLDLFLGVKAPDPAVQLDPAHLASSATPQLWYLAPQAELAGFLSTVGR
jgi:protease-4